MLLSILIPTYNRHHKVLELINFLSKEILSCISDLEIIVGDNASNDSTYEDILSHPLFELSNINIIKNPQNLGLVGNLINLSQKASGEYIWFMGDDDIYKSDIVNKVINQLKEKRPALMFINHEAYIEGEKGYSGFSSAVDVQLPAIYEDGRKGIYDIWNTSDTSLMFISCIIYNKNLLIDAIHKREVTNLASPLFYSLYVGGKGKLVIIKDILIENVWGNVSWKSSMYSIFIDFIPQILYSLHKYGYSNKMTITISIKYLWKNKFLFIKYWKNKLQIR
ncbi:MAG: glycosyltransferase family 2 protein [Parabacteroides gordonii]|uniref:glycosyltransferase family 2 protein n=1 Tax=Parabacteroides gordonii TaxID=574930 RepID=UPI003A8BA3E8